jgi:hypothetical protein
MSFNGQQMPVARRIADRPVDLGRVEAAVVVIVVEFCCVSTEAAMSNALSESSAVGPSER